MELKNQINKNGNKVRFYTGFVFGKRHGHKYENLIIALGFLVLLAVFVGYRFDYFYDLNDDVLMKDILAGVYTGTPEGHNIQMLWLVSAFISFFYRLARGLPWYGIFLCACHYGCFFLILKRSLVFCRTRWGKLAVCLVEGLFFVGVFLEHLIFAQYTVTCTFLGATAAFLFYTTDIGLSGKEFVRENIPAVLLVAVAYLIRSEMLLLVLPMICVAGAAKWGSEEKIFTWEHAFKYFTVIGLILAGILIGQVSHRVAYGSKEWRDFTAFFDNRTELYDFQAPPVYGEHQEFYESIGLSESEKVLLDNYNFGMDEEIDHVMVGQIAEYAGKNKSEEEPFVPKLRVKLKDYAYRLLHGPKAVGSDYPWNYMVILGYVAVFCTAIPGKGRDGQGQKKERDAFSEKNSSGEGASYGLEKRSDGKDGRGTKIGLWVRNAFGAAWKLAFLFGVRTALWMFILMRDRAPERITHSLYLMEFCILTAMVLVQWSEISREKVKRLWGVLAAVCFGLLALTAFPGSVEAVSVRQAEREKVNVLYRELYDYLSEGDNGERFYLIDVYSSVSDGGVPYSEKMFQDVDNSLDNYDIMGGWACKSPLQRKKLKLFGIENMESALKDREDVFFVRKSSEDMQWIFDYYEGHGTPVEAQLVDKVADVFEIYAVSEISR